MDEYVLLDTGIIKNALSRKAEFLKRYDDLRDEYVRIVKELSENWKGYGADAFSKDALKVQKKIGSIYDILKTMSDTIDDCITVFSECDTSLGKYNEDPK